MKVVIPGGSGQIGKILCRHFLAAGHEVVVLGRQASEPGKKTINSGFRFVPWNGTSQGAWEEELDGADIVINLAGRSVNCRYTPANREAILDSRVQSTRAVANAISRVRRPPRVWLQSSTATIYPHRFDAPNDESSSLETIPGTHPDPGWKFSVKVATAWEQTAAELPISQTRLVLMRTAMVMSPDRDGVFDVLLGLARKGLGGSIAGGQQFMSWIHDRDFVRAVDWAISHEKLRGPVNFCSPNPLPQREFMRQVRKAAAIPVGLPATRWMLAIGTRLMKTESELVLKSRRVVPRRMLESGFSFQFPDWEYAAADLWGRWRELKASSGTVHSNTGRTGL